MPILQFDDLSKVYPSGTTALSDVNFSIDAGELVSFVGPSGCGKSTIFRIVAGLEQASSGKVSVLSGSVDAARRSNAISCVFQDPTLMPWASILDNVSLPLRLRKRPVREQVAEAERVLELVGLREQAHSLPQQLSGGMKMRAAIARAIVVAPRILLMDEPFAALDEITRQALQDQLLHIRDNNPDMAILFVTHNAFEAAYLSSRVLVMKANPGSITDSLPIDAGYPRGGAFRGSADFTQYVASITQALQRGAQ